MKSLEDWAAVHRVYGQTKSKRRTAEILGISRNTVKRLLEMKEKPKYHRDSYSSILDPYKEQIICWRCEPYFFNGKRIFRELKALGYEGSIGPVYRFLKKADEDVDGMISSKATIRHESPPGDQAQFDWTEYEVLIGQKYRKVYCFAMILAASRKKAVCFSLTVDAEAIYEAVQELFDDLGGVTLELLIDNPKALVLENNPKSEDEIKYNPHALLLAKHLGTELNACPCYWPRKKGKIESPFKYIEEQFIKGTTFASMEDLNSRGKVFIDQWCNEVHGTTKRIPNQHYLLEERSILQPLPEKRYFMRNASKRVVSNDSYVRIDGSKYSVPVQYATKIVYFRLIYGFRIMITDSKGNAVWQIEKSEKLHDEITIDSHYEAIAPKTPTSIPQIRRDFTALFKNGARYLEAAGRKYDQPTHYARKILEYRELYEVSVLDLLIGVAIEEESLDIKSFRKLLKKYNSGEISLEEKKQNTSKESTETKTTTDQSLTRNCSYYENL